MDSVATLRVRRQALLDSVAPSGLRPGGYGVAVALGYGDLTPAQRATWVPLEVAKIDAEIAEHEFLNSLLDEPLDDERRAAIIEDLFDEILESEGRDAAETADIASESDWGLVLNHARYLEAVAAEEAYQHPDSPSLQDETPRELLDLDAEASES